MSYIEAVFNREIMSNKNAFTLLSLMNSFASDAVDLQRKFDKQNEVTLKSHTYLLCQLGGEMASYLPSPNQVQVHQFEASARMEWRQRESKSASFKVILQNLSADLRYSRQTENDSRFNIQVERIPCSCENPFISINHNKDL